MPTKSLKPVKRTYKYEIRTSTAVKHATTLDNARKVGRQFVEQGARFAEIFEARYDGKWDPAPRGRVEKYEGKITWLTKEGSMTIHHREIKKDGSLGGIVYGFG